MSKVIIGLFVLLVVIGISFAIYFATKKGQDGVEKIPDKPQFTFEPNATKTINPQEGADEEDTVDTSEGYRIEYADGDDSEKSSLIDLTLSWKNGQGYDSVSSIILTRYVGSTKIQENMVVTEPDMLKDYGKGSVTFKGTDVSEGVSVKGENIIKAYWNEVKDSNELATAKIKIDDDDFSYTVTGPFGDYDVEVSIVSDTFELKKSVKKIYYNLSFNPDFWFKLIDHNDKTYTFKSINDSSTLKLDNIDRFKMKSYKGRQMLIHPNDDKKIMVIYGNSPEKFISESEMTRQDWGRASFTLTAASTITPGHEDYEDIKQGYDASQSYKSPNGNYRLEFQDDGNLVLRDKEDTVMWESMTHANGKGEAKRIVVRPKWVDNDTKFDNAALTFVKSRDFIDDTDRSKGFKDQDIIEQFKSNIGGFTRPYSLILGDDGILSIIDKIGRRTDTLDFVAKHAKPGEAIKCGSGHQIYRYIGHNQINHYESGEAASSLHGKHWGDEFLSLDGNLCKNTRTGPTINGSVVDDFPKLTYDDSIDLGIGNLCTGDANKINTMKNNCKNHDTCGGIGQQDNSCWHQFSGKGHRWPKSHGYKRTINVGRNATNGSYLFRI